MMTDRPDLTITIVSWNTRELLRSCLQSLRESGARASFEIHVVDNGSHDGSAELVRAEFPDVQLIANEQNLGFAAANNQSWAQARGRYWLLLNSDTEVKLGALDALIALLDAQPRAGLVTARLINPDGTPQHCAQATPSIWRVLLEASRLHKLLPAALRGRVLLGPYWNYCETRRIGWTWGTGLIARRAAIEQVGPLSEAFFMYGEDLEWCLRMRRRGWEIWFCHAAEVLHYGGQSSAQQWPDVQKQQIIRDNCYKAIEMHRWLLSVWLLKMATWCAFRAEQISKRLKERLKGRRTLSPSENAVVVPASAGRRSLPKSSG